MSVEATLGHAVRVRLRVREEFLSAVESAMTNPVFLGSSGCSSDSVEVPNGFNAAETEELLRQEGWLQYGKFERWKFQSDGKLWREAVRKAEAEALVKAQTPARPDLKAVVAQVIEALRRAEEEYGEDRLRDVITGVTVALSTALEAQ